MEFACIDVFDVSSPGACCDVGCRWCITLASYFFGGTEGRVGIRGLTRLSGVLSSRGFSTGDIGARGSIGGCTTACTAAALWFIGGVRFGVTSISVNRNVWSSLYTNTKWELRVVLVGWQVFRV